MLSNLILNWITLSSLYLLVAIGFTLIYGVAGHLNLAHGASIIIGGSIAWQVTMQLGYSIWIGLLAAMFVGAAFNWLLFILLVKKLEEDPIAIAILTLAVFLFIEHLIFTIIGSSPKAIPSIVPGNTDIFGLATVSNNRIVIVALSLAIVAVLIYFINETRQGKAINAVSMAPRGSVLVGINTSRIFLYTWIIAGAIAAVAGVFLGSITTVNPAMGFRPLILSFAIVIVGGIGSIKGSVVAAYIIGFLEVSTTLLIDPNLALLTPLLALLIVLIVKPEGLYGREEVGH